LLHKKKTVGRYFQGAVASKRAEDKKTIK
jgi:hypothetical protein